MAVVSLTFGYLFFKDVYKHRHSKYPLNYNHACISQNKKEYPNCIKDRTSKDIVKDRFIFGKTKVPNNIDYIIIGSGIGGLSVASYLSRAGYKCLVLEQHDRIGGCMHQYSGKYGFDVGIHYIGRAMKHEKDLKLITDNNNNNESSNNCYPIKFIKMGNESNNNIYDKYYIGSGKNQIIYNAKHGIKQLNNLKEYFKNDNNKLNIINILEKRIKQAKIAVAICIISRMIYPEWFGKLLFNFTKWWFNDVFNKTIKQVCDNIGLSNLPKDHKNSLLKMIFLANVGNLGGLTNNSSFGMFALMFEHYREGGYYIEGGPQQITRAIMPVIEKNGGRCLANARVEKILFSENGRAIGVKIENKGKNLDIFCRKGVISTVGLRLTFSRLAPINDIKAPIKYKQRITRVLNEIAPSCQHFQCFIGFNKNSKELNLPSNNCWFLHFNEESTDKQEFNYDEFISSLHKDPLNGPLLALIGFPSAKDPLYNKMHGENKATCVIVTEIPRYHFEKWSNEPCGGRSKEYEILKEKIGMRLINELLLKYFPQITMDCIDKIKFGSALTTEHYLGSMYGESYGLHNDCKRYFDFDIGRVLTPNTPIKGLYLAGQDVISSGWAGALHAGLVCAEKILGYHDPAVIVAGRTLQGDIEKMLASNTK